MEALEFAKGHGTGNDFVIIPDPAGARELTPELVAALCDRHRGVGGDGLLRVVHDDTGWFMDYRNADGSVAETCGNGVRVFVRYLVDAGMIDPTHGDLTVVTRAGPVIATVSDEAVSVTMRMPRVYGEGVAVLGDGRALPGVAVDCGNPHLVCLLPADLPLAGIDLDPPPAVDPGLFPEGVNVEMVSPPYGLAGGPLQLLMRVHERGVGETLSCGSGACAAAVVALRDAGRTSGLVAVDVPGGRLLVSLTDVGCVLTGPAVVVARGSVNLDAVTGLLHE